MSSVPARRRIGWTLALGIAFGVHPSWAGDGPWVAGNGNASLFVGLEGQRIDRLHIRDAQGQAEIIDVDDGISTLGVKAIGTVGVRDRFEVEFAVPWYQARANRQDGPLCTLLGLQACATTEGIGIVSVRAKGTVLDELYGAPVSLAVGLETRFGQLTSGTRARITNIGEGTTDVGLFTAVGRSARLGSKGYWMGFVEGLGRYRIPNSRSYEGSNAEERAAPGFEVAMSTKALFGWNSHVGLGPVADLYTRPMGFNFGDLDLDNIDRFAALKVLHMRVGAQVLLRANDRLSFTGSVTHTVVAQNNPYTTVLSIGISHFGMLSKKEP